MPELTIAGPNLQSGSTFHVHKAGCSDLKRRVVYRGAQVDTAEYASVQEVVEDIYADMMAENDPDSEYATWQGYVSEFDFFPCCGEIPDVVAEVPEATEEISETSLQADQPDATVITSSKAPTTKGTKKAKEAPVSTKSNTNTRRTWNKNKAKQVVSRRNKGMSWRAIGDELGFSPRTVRSMFDAIEGADAHFDSRLPGKGGRTRSGVNEAKAKLAAEAAAE